MSRMSGFNSKFGGGRDNCDAKELACAERYRILGIAIVAPPPKFTIEFRHSWYSRYLQRFRIRKINQTGKYEAIQI